MAQSHHISTTSKLQLTILTKGKLCRSVYSVVFAHGCIS
ncbi:unnamed protein product [Arabidopsis halleri]